MHEPVAEKPRRRLPTWIRTRVPGGAEYARLKALLREKRLATVCEEAQCPNVHECWGGGTATVMLLGDTCTRGCRFCAVKTARTPPPPDPDEPLHLAETLSELGLTYVVITMVDRDDLQDGGADHVARCVAEVKRRRPSLLVEVLVSDFQGDRAAVEAVLAAGPDVYAHNVETVERLTPSVRDARCDYRQSLDVLRHAKQAGPARLLTKSSIMLGLGETEDDLRATFADLRAAGVDIVTLGQYLRPTAAHLPVARWWRPDEFEHLAAAGAAMGFAHVQASPLTRSSYHARDAATAAARHPAPTAADRDA
jgi:lipoyl synthase